MKIEDSRKSFCWESSIFNLQSGPRLNFNRFNHFSIGLMVNIRTLTYEDGPPNPKTLRHTQNIKTRRSLGGVPYIYIYIYRCSPPPPLGYLPFWGSDLVLHANAPGVVLLDSWGTSHGFPTPSSSLYFLNYYGQALKQGDPIIVPKSLNPEQESFECSPRSNGLIH